ncbi:nucleoside hydrolase [Streptomyces sp. NPDC004647]|uniref:nucleoside hydrolase n=1 Tax=Streptomyces sp. NPDC004647 TaxID=3154671 RepID=UPI0033B7A41B
MALTGAGSPQDGGRRPVVIDTDPGVDDTWAILALAGRPNVELVAIGAAHGNVPAATSAENALRVLDAAGLHQVPVAVGHPTPLQQALHTAEFVHGDDGLGGHAGPPSRRRPADESAAEQLVRLARQRPGELSLLALAPLTNIALALRLEPMLPQLVKQVHYMGGAFRSPRGNITPWADANTWHDPEAAEEVLRAGFDLTMVPMDVTEHAFVDEGWLEEIASHRTPATDFATSIMGNYCELYASMNGSYGCVMHDPLAAAIMCQPSLARYETHPAVVELAGRSRGAVLLDQRSEALRNLNGISDNRRPVKIAFAVDAGKSKEWIREGLLNLDPDVGIQ